MRKYTLAFLMIGLSACSSMQVASTGDNKSDRTPSSVHSATSGDKQQSAIKRQLLKDLKKLNSLYSELYSFLFHNRTNLKLVEAQACASISSDERNAAIAQVISDVQSKASASVEEFSTFLDGLAFKFDNKNQNAEEFAMSLLSNSGFLSSTFGFCQDEGDQNAEKSCILVRFSGEATRRINLAIDSNGKISSVSIPLRKGCGGGD